MASSEKSETPTLIFYSDADKTSVIATFEIAVSVEKTTTYEAYSSKNGITVPVPDGKKLSGWYGTTNPALTDAAFYDIATAFGDGPSGSGHDSYYYPKYEWSASSMLAAPSDLESVADSIRTKSGSSDKLSFPDGFTSAIDSLPTVTVDGEKVSGDLALKSAKADIRMPDLPAAFYNGCAVAFTNGIHILGGSLGTNNTGHYVYNGTSWSSAKVLPFTSFAGSNACCALMDGLGTGIHVMYSNYHYAYNYSSAGGTTASNTWTRVNNPPSSATNATAVACDGKIHLVGGTNTSTSHYVWSRNTGWVGAAAVPYACTGCKAVVYTDGKIHLLGGASSSNNENKKHVIYDESTNAWTLDTAVPNACYESSAVSIDGAIYLYGGTSNRTQQLMFKDGVWTKLANITAKHSNFGNAAVVYAGMPHLLGSDYTPTSGEGLVYSKMHLLPSVEYMYEE